MTLGLQRQITGGFAATQAEEAYVRARRLCDLVPDAPLFRVLWGLWLFYKVRSDLAKAFNLAGELLALARKLDDPALVLQSQQALAVTRLCLGEPAATCAHMEEATALYDPHKHRGHASAYGQDPGVSCLSFGAIALWLLGEPDRAAEKSRAAVALAGELSQPSSLALALLFAAMLQQCRGDPRAVLECAETSAGIASEQGFSFWLAGATVMRGWALAEEGAAAEGIAQMREGLSAWEATGSVTYRTYYLALLAETLGKRGETGEALRVLAEALDLAHGTGERLYEAELHRLRGEFLRAGGEPPPAREAEECFRRALAVARRQGTRSLELRAAMSLARLSRERGDETEARALLAEVLAAFTEGWDTPDLREAKALLEGEGLP
jgi:predicted ATPase